MKKYATLEVPNWLQSCCVISSLMRLVAQIKEKLLQLIIWSIWTSLEVVLLAERGKYIFNQLIIKFNHYQLLIINHTMLQNSPSATLPNHLPLRPHSNLLLLHTLLEEVEQHKRSLAQALAINGLLVQQTASTLLPNTPTDDGSNQPQMQVKLEACEEESSQSAEIRGRRQVRRGRREEQEEGHDKNETKNIPKNYGKAILSFIQKNIQKYLSIIKPILGRGKLTINDLLLHIKRHKKEVNSINYLKEMWGYQDRHNPILKCIRVLSYIFMRKHCLAYIFNSRVKNYSTHIKYRTRIIEGIEHPEEFTCIKQF